MPNVLTKTGIYLAYPTTPELKSIYRPKNYKTKVNNEHTKIGIAKDSFEARSKGYYSNFDNEVVFTPLAIIDDISVLIPVEQVILSEIRAEFNRVGRAREWFATNNRGRIVEIVNNVLVSTRVQHSYIG